MRNQTFSQNILDIVITIARYPLALVMLGLCLLGFLVVDYCEDDAKRIANK